MSWTDDDPVRAAQNLSTQEDEKVAKNLLLAMALQTMTTTGGTPVEILKLVTMMVRDIRAGERLKLSIADKGRSVANSIPEQDAEAKR